MTTSSVAQLVPVGVSFPRGAQNTQPTTRASIAERKLVARLRAGDESAFSELVRRNHGALMRLALVFLPNRALAEEAVQDTWTAVIDRLSTFEGRSSLKTWIFRILANRAQTRLRHEVRSVPFSALTDSDFDEPATEPSQSGNSDSPERRVMNKEAIRCLERALQELPPQQRAVATLRDVEGLESEEVCKILGVGETHQRVLLHRARSKLRRALEEHRIAA